MYLNKYWAWLLTLLLWVAAGSAAAETPLNLSLILGDLDSQTAVAATVKLQNDPLLQGVKLRVYSSSKLAQATRPSCNSPIWYWRKSPAAAFCAKAARCLNRSPRAAASCMRWV
ncbi:hypothetical protein [Methylomonas koyamae]|uniref:hypothetical protein n=1 Tax=Methylomonas koyamae TaxID=702114 RepID=UPI0006D2388A|nr:hypothetical protein [Methylomonas koyamae]